MNELIDIIDEYEHGRQYVECHDYGNESSQYADDVMNTSEWLELSDAVDDDWMRLLAGLFLHVKNNNDSKRIRDKAIQCYDKIIHEHVTYGRNKTANARYDEYNMGIILSGIGIRSLNDFLTWDGITINMLKGMADALHAKHDELEITVLNRNQIRVLADDYSDGMPPEFIREELKALADNNHGMLADMFK